MRSSLRGAAIGLVFVIVALSQIYFILSLLLTPLWFDVIIREEESIICRLFDRLWYFFYLRAERRSPRILR